MKKQMSSSVRVNPYRLFSLPEPGQGNFTRQELKQRMKKLILITHPDKPTGSEKKFRIVMECYKHLSNILKEREKLDRQVTSGVVEETRLLRESEKVEIPASNFTRFVKGSGNKFDLNAFNNFFEENKLDNPMDRGHGDWLSKHDEESERRQKQRIAKGDFDRAFEQERRRVLKETRIVKRVGLESAYHNGNGTSLDEEEAYGNVVVKTSHGLTGVDVREAHENGIIAVNDPRYQGVTGRVSMDEAKRMRDVSMNETEEDRLQWEREMAEKEQMRKERERRILEQNRRIEDNYTRVNKLLGQ